MPDVDQSIQEVLQTFYPASGACTGNCNFTWNGSQWVPGGDTCTGGCGCPAPPAALKKLLDLKCGPQLAQPIVLSCAASGNNSNEPAIQAYLELLKKYYFLIKVAIGLGILVLILLMAVIYLLLR